MTPVAGAQPDALICAGLLPVPVNGLASHVFLLVVCLFLVIQGGASGASSGN